jgi:hypothetical protein
MQEEESRKKLKAVKDIIVDLLSRAALQKSEK